MILQKDSLGQYKTHIYVLAHPTTHPKVLKIYTRLRSNRRIFQKGPQGLFQAQTTTQVSLGHIDNEQVTRPLKYYDFF